MPASNLTYALHPRPLLVQNLCLELATMGDLKLVERPQNYTLAAGQTKVVRANIKVRFVLIFSKFPRRVAQLHPKGGTSDAFDAWELAGADDRILQRSARHVSSTETGVIFGNIVYEGTGYAERSVVVLNDIHIDIMDYISPAVCADVQFRCAPVYGCAFISSACMPPASRVPVVCQGRQTKFGKAWCQNS
eukprot:1147146-Pelagomonas_calceolata.AAC.3